MASRRAAATATNTSCRQWSAEATSARTSGTLFWPSTIRTRNPSFNPIAIFRRRISSRSEADPPAPLSDQIATTATPSGAAPILLPPSSPFYPHDRAQQAGVDGQPLNVRYRCVECGNRDLTDTNEAWQIVAGAKGTMWTWDWDG